MAEEQKVAKLVFERMVNGQQTLIIMTTTNLISQGQIAKTAVPTGSPFWWWDAIPYNASTVVACDFTGAPIKESTDTATTLNQKIAEITALPEDVLTSTEQTPVE